MDNPAVSDRSANAAPAVDLTAPDSSFLRTLVGYNTRRATLRIFEVFHDRMRDFGLNPVEFSVLSLIGRNAGITARQICEELAMPPPKLAKLLAVLDRRALIHREATQADRRAFHLSLTQDGHRLRAQVEPIVQQLEVEASAQLTDRQRDMVNSLLQRIYR